MKNQNIAKSNWSLWFSKLLFKAGFGKALWVCTTFNCIFKIQNGDWDPVLVICVVKSFIVNLLIVKPYAMILKLKACRIHLYQKLSFTFLPFNWLNPSCI